MEVQQPAGTVVPGARVRRRRLARGRGHAALAGDALAVRLLAVVEDSSDFVGVAGPEGELLYLNPAGREVFGVPADHDLQGLSVPGLLSEESLDVLLHEALPALRRGSRWQGTLSMRTLSGDVIPVSQVLLAHRDVDGRIEAYSAVARDVSVERAIEARLAHSEARYRVLAEESPVGIAHVDHGGVVTDANRRWFEITGRRREDVLGAPMDLRNVHPDDRAAVTEPLLAALAQGATWTGQVRVVRPDGETRQVRCSVRAPGNAAAVIATIEDITDEHEARGIVSRLEALLAATPDVAGITDLEGRLLYLNDGGRRLLGFGPDDEVVGTSGRDIVAYTPESWARIDAEMADALATDGMWTGELTMLTREGREVPVSQVTIAHRGADGEVDCFSTIARDISGLKRVEQALAASEAWYRSLVQHAMEIVVVHDADVQLVYASPAAVELVGASELHGDAALGFIHPDDVDALTEVYARAIETPGAVHATEMRVRGVDGRWHDLETLVTNLLDDPVVCGMVTNARDVTERRDAQRALRLSENRFRALVANTSDLIVVLDPTGTVRYASPAVETMLGYDSAGRPGFSAVEWLHPDDAEATALLIAEALTTDEVVGPVELRIRHADGTYRLAEAVSRNLVHDPAVGGLVVTIRDVTEARAADEALRRKDERFRALIQNLADAITVIAADGTVEYESPAAEEIFGFGPDHPSRSHPLTRVHPDDRGRLEDTFATIIGGGGRSEPMRFRLLDGWGHWRDVEAVAIDMLEDPAVHGIVVTARDVTARVRAERLVADQAEVLRLVAQGAPLPQTMARLCEVVEDHAPGSAAGVLLVDRDGDHLHLVAGPSLPDAFTHKLEHVPIAPHGSPCGMAAFGGVTVLAGDLETDPRWAPYAGVALDHGVRAAWAAPIFASGGDRVLGTVALYRREPGEPSPEEQELVAMATHLGAIAIERKAFEDRLAHQAHHDPLTGLPNRVLFVEFLTLALARSARRQGAVAVLFLDLDRFKVVNDSLGHDAGDELLTKLSARIRSVLRPGDTVARFGGDEFTVLCEDLDPEAARDQAIEVAERLLQVIDQPFDLAGDEAHLTTSIGIALGAAGDLPEALLRDADAAMYRAKELGKSRWELFDEAMRTSARLRLETESALHRAIQRGELELHYQPIVDLTDGRCVGAEALVRWAHPERGLIGPVEFIELAEETGLILPLGAWVLEEALRQVRAWHDGALVDADFTMSVNLSARQLAQPDVVRRVADTLEATGAEPAWVCLEITESVLMGAASVEVLDALRALGVHLSIDDFGTGYSSLGYLKRFPVSAVKVDRSFVDGLGVESGDRAIVDAVVSLGHALGLTVVAEGVETTAQVAELVALGCDRAQGYWFARPQPAVALARVLREGFELRRWKRDAAR